MRNVITDILCIIAVIAIIIGGIKLAFSANAIWLIIIGALVIFVCYLMDKKDKVDEEVIND